MREKSPYPAGKHGKSRESEAVFRPEIFGFFSDDFRVGSCLKAQ